MIKITSKAVILILIFLSLSLGSCIILPTISETHLLSDIQEDELSISVGTEQPIGEAHVILPDVLFEYVSYAPADWVEFGLAGHYSVGLIGIDARFDVIDMFTDNSPLSGMIVGGVLFLSGGSGPIVHFGAAANYRFNRTFEVYACAATSTLLFVPVFHFGTNINIFDWLSLSGNLKMGLNTFDANSSFPPVAFMFSVAPRISFDL